ncbi:MAG: response regulator [Eubacteriales bacterium]|nr:response regulator [Eubacteriales bacterium]
MDNLQNQTEETTEHLQEAKEHFLRNIRQLGNNALLVRRLENGRMEPVFASEGFARMMECSVEEAMELYSGRGFYKTTNPEDRPLVRSMIKNRVAYDGSQTLTIQKVTAKRNQIWCSIHYAFIDDYGEHYIYCTCSDVTALKQYEEKFRSTYTALGNSFYQVNEHTLSMVRVNLTKDSFEEIRGRDLFNTDSVSYSYSESMLQHAEHFPIRPEREKFLEEFDCQRLCEGYLKGKTTVSQVLYSIRRDGRSCFVRITASITRHPLSGDLISFMTERECNSDKVRETLMDKILAQQFDMVCYLVNGQYGVTIGQSVRTRRGNIFPVSVSGSYQTYLKRQVYPVLVGGEEEKRRMQEALSLESVERELAQKEPYVVDIAVQVGDEIYYKQFDFYSIDPEARFYILLKSDTTEIQKAHLAMNEQLRLALDAANQANVAKTAFLSSMSHEIRTPMNAIIGLDSIALTDPDLPPRTREHLEKIGDSARHLLGLINDILDMSRIESGRMTVRSEEFSFPDMLSQINTIVEGQCREKSLTYMCHVGPGAEDYYIGDVMKIKQVLINILGNAVKFTSAPGEVRFLIEKASSFEDQTVFSFTIQDTGIGMDRNYLPRIFDAFSQENTAVNNRYGSTGLGMAITKNIIDMMNGTIQVESEKGVGSTFTVTLPLRNCTRRRAGAITMDPKKMNVLVVDDDPVACEHARIVLEEIGISADLVQSGEEALENIRLRAARQEAYNLIFVDWKMPGRDGIEVTREIRQTIGPRSAVIILTAYNWDEIEEEALDAGVDGFMAKPLLAGGVLDAYAQAVSAGKFREEAEETPAVKKQLSECRILLAEDMFINAEIMKEVLKMKGMQVEHAENGQEALDLFKNHPAHYFDAVLMDLRMPVMDGLTAASGIRTCGREDSATIPIIALTANAFDEDVQRSLQAGMNAHLSKPVEPEQLYQTLEKFI